MTDTGTGAALLSQAQEEFQTVKIGGARVILSVRDSETLGGTTGLGDDFSDNAGLYLYAEQLILAADTKLARTAASAQAATPLAPVLNVIAVHKLIITPAADGSSPTLDVSGQDGAPPVPSINQGTTPIAPQHGGAGSIFSLYAEAIAPPTATVAIAAGGGAGSTGQAGVAGVSAGGDGGNGGAAGTVTIVAVQAYAQIIGRLNAAYALTDAAAMVTAVQKLRADFATLDAIKPVDAIKTGATIDAAQAAIAAALTAAYPLQQDWQRSQINIAGGTFGALGTGKPNGHDGITGAGGRIAIHGLATLGDIAALTKAPLFPLFLWAHPSQAAMLLEKARLLYLTLDHGADDFNDSLNALTILLTRLRDRTAPFMALQPTDTTNPLVAAAAAGEAAVGAVSAIASLQGTGQFAAQYLSQLAQGLNCFGRASQFTPVVAYATIEKLIEQAIDDFGTIETGYNAYYTSLAASDARMGQFTGARTSAETALQSNNTQLTDVIDAATATEAQIIKLQASFLEKRANLTTVLADCVRAIEGYFNVPSMSDLLGAIGQLGFAPEGDSLIMISQAGQLLDSGLSTITNDQGQKIQKGYLIRSIKSVSADIDSLTEASKATTDGGLAPDDPGASKLVADEQKVLSLLDGLSGALPREYQTVKTAFEGYVNAVLERNNQILQYNAEVALMLQLAGEMANLKDRVAALTDSVLSTMQADNPDLTTFASRVYYSSRNIVLRLLDDAARAYRFWALDDTTTLGSLLGGSSIPQINSLALTGAKTAILDRYLSAITKFGGGAASFPANDGQTGIIVPLSATQIAMLQQPNSDGDFEVMVRIPIPSRTSTIADNPFNGKANVRITRVRLWLDASVKPCTSEGSININLTHLGREQLANADGTVFTFTHERRAVTFAYKPTPDGNSITADGEFGFAAGEIAPSPYALYGPFAQWQIQIRKSLNCLQGSDGTLRVIDLSNLTSARFEFHGTSLTAD